MASKPRVKVPKKASAGDVITIKTLLNHKMETGLRKDKEGNLVARKIINKFQCQLDGAEIFSCDIDPAISANPYIQFTAKVEKSGSFKFIWTDDDGSTIEAEKPIEVS